MIKCTSFSQSNNGSLRGYATILVPKWGIELGGVPFFQSGDKQWVSLPSRYYQGGDGKTKFVPVLEFVEAKHKAAFLDQVRDAIKRFLGE